MRRVSPGLDRGLKVIIDRNFNKWAIFPWNWILSLFRIWPKVRFHTHVRTYFSPQRQRWFGVCRECWLPDILWPALGISSRSGDMATMIFISPSISWLPSWQLSPRSATFRLPLVCSTMSRFLGVMWPRTTPHQVVYVWQVYPGQSITAMQPPFLYFDWMILPGFLEMTMTSLSPETRGCRFFYPSTHLKKYLLFNPPNSEIQTKRFREKVFYSV